MSRRLAATGVVLLSLVTGCSNGDSDSNKAEADRTSSAPTQPASTTPTPSAPPGESQICLDATELMVKGLDKTWRQDVAPVDPYSRLAPLMVSGWLLKYATAAEALDREGCTVPPPGLETLDVAVTDLSTALDGGNTSVLAYTIKLVAQELRVLNVDTTADSDVPASCADLRATLEVSYELRDESAEVGRSLYPHIVVHNSGAETAIVAFYGTGHATSEFGGSDMTWGGYASSSVRVPPDGTRDINLGRSTGETLYVAEGERVTKVTIRATASTGDRAISGCRIPTSDSAAEPPVDTQLRLGETAHLEHIDVSVTGKRDVIRTWGIRVTVCYTQPIPDTPTITVSTEPWSFHLNHPGGESDTVKVSELGKSRTWSPAYRRAELSLDECNSGWIETFGSGTSPIRIAGATYQPDESGPSVTWTWKAAPTEG